jgi:hypothetical protein
MLMMPSAVELSVWTAKYFTLLPRLRAFVYNAPISALAADDMTALMMEALL